MLRATFGTLVGETRRFAVFQARIVPRISGLCCLLGAGVILLGTYLTWFHVITDVRGFDSSALGVDIYHLSVARVATSSNSWSAAAIDFGVAGLVIVGSGLALSRQLPLLWATLWISISIALTALGALEARLHGVFYVSVYSYATRGPGEVVTLAGAGIGLLAALLAGWAQVAKSHPSASSTPSQA